MNVRLAVLTTVLAALAGNDGVGTPIDMANPPHLKAGLWTETGTVQGMPRAPRSVCDPGSAIFPSHDDKCREWRAVRAPDGAIDFNMECSDAGTTIRGHRHIVGDLASGFTDDSVVTTLEGNVPTNTVSVHSVRRYVGPCPPGMKPVNPTPG